MMKIAIPLFGSRVSPRFDCAPDILLATVEGDKVVARENLSNLRWRPLKLINHLIQRGAEVVICGAIDGFSARFLAQRGARVIPWVTGEAEEALKLFMEGRLEPGVILHPGGKRRRWRFGGGREPWQEF